MADGGESQRVLVSGASGYIATWVVRKLLEEGYKVRGTVRSLANEKKVAPLRNLHPNAKDNLELVEADLTKPESWEKAAEGCTYVLHTASPFPPAKPANPEEEVIKPAVEGTKSVLEACRKAGVKRVVLTSSVAAVSGGWGDSDNPDRVFTEEDWTDPDKAQPYERSKTLAEKAAWEFQSKLPEEERFELAVVNPVYVMGPVLCGSSCTSMEVPKRLLERSMPALPKLYLQIVDVRDVAAAHLRAMVIPEAAGKRHVLTAGGMWMSDIAKTMDPEFMPQGYNVPTKNIPYAFAAIFGVFDSTVKMILPMIGKIQHLNNDRMKNVLGVQPRPLPETIIPMCYSLIEQGFVKKTRKYKGVPDNVKLD